MPEIVYVLTNPAMPGLVKIGHTQELAARMKQLDSTGVPLPFECFFAAEVVDAKTVERALHEAFEDHRIRQSREFFRLSPEKPRAIVRLLALNEVTLKSDVVESADDQRALNTERRRRSNFSFSSVGIAKGEELESVFDESQKAIVLDDRNVQFRGQRRSLSSSALEIAQENGWNWTSIAGPNYWKHDGTTLAELREMAAVASTSGED